VNIILVAGALGLLGTLLGTKGAIALLVKKGYGQYIRDDGPKEHLKKAGTPTMGGTVIIVSVLFAYLVAHLIFWRAPTISGLLLLFLFVGQGFVGFLDDWIKISHARSLGLDSKAKLIGQTAVALVFAFLALQFPDARGVTPASPAVSFMRDIPALTLPAAVAVIWMVFIIASMSNGVNLTDGLDGLATGASTIVFAAYTMINLWEYYKSCAYASSGPQCYEVRDPFDLSLISLALAGACFGFLWWNASPAKIFMGDTGSLSLGGALAGLAILSRGELLLVILGGLFVIITMSVALQIGFFKLTHGKRLFKMAPLQHHFEMLGWAEVTIVVRFWIACGIFVALGFGLFFGEVFSR
jgi:phospho-N-acetylmuramoyl-pentapeptide-transferase